MSKKYNLDNELITNILTHNEYETLVALDIISTESKDTLEDFMSISNPLSWIKKRETLEKLLKELESHNTDSIKHKRVGELLNYNYLDKCIRFCSHGFTGDDPVRDVVVVLEKRINVLRFIENVCRDVLNRIDRLTEKQVDMLIENGKLLRDYMDVISWEGSDE